MKKVKDHLNEQKYWDIFTIPANSNLFDAATLMNKNKIEYRKGQIGVPLLLATMVPMPMPTLL